MRTISAANIASAHPHSMHPDDALAVAYGRRVRAEAKGRDVVDTLDAWVVWLPGLPPVPRWGFSERDLDAEWFAGLDEDDFERVARDDDRDLIVIQTSDAADAWFEEDEQVHVHPRDPFGRVEVRATGRKVVVTTHGVVVAESHRAQLVYETGLPLRCYVPRCDVAAAALAPSNTRTICPYKGVARHFHVVWDDEPRVVDGAWCYPLPRFDLPQITDHVSFYEHDATTVQIDGLGSVHRANDR